MDYSVERCIEINADLATVRPHVANLQNWDAWSPWTVIEPNHRKQFHGEEGAVGSKMSWDGDVIGSGEMTVTHTSEEQIQYDLVFLKPWKSEAKTVFKLKEVSGKTTVTWVMKASSPFYLFFMVGMIKAMVAMDYDRGLVMLKSIVETGEVDADTNNMGIIDFQGFGYAGLLRTSPLSEMPQNMAADFEQVLQACVKQGIEPEHVISVYNKVKLSKQIFSYTSAVGGLGLDKLDGIPGLTKGRIKSQKMLEIKHRGSYDYIGNAWSMGHLTLRANKLKQNGVPFEYYHNSPTETAETDLLTSIYFPVKG